MSEEMRFIYEQAMNKLKTKLDSLYSEYYSLGKEKPIEYIKYRIKSDDSIQYKIARKGKKMCFSDIVSYVSDVVGARIVCSFLSDVETVINRLKSDPEIDIVCCKDYIHESKDNGYASYHIIVNIPVVLDNNLIYVKGEIQIRTIAQDMWASLDHKIRYKKGIQLSRDTENAIMETSVMCSTLDRYFNDRYLESKKRLKTDDVISACDWMKGFEYDKMILKYQSALKEVENKILQMYDSFSLHDKYYEEPNPIEHIKCRIKSPSRMLWKLKQKTDDLSLQSLEEKVSDIAAIRIVCSFTRDLDEIILYIKNIFSKSIIKEKDYVTAPKESGYASYHFIVGVPVNCDGIVEIVKVEIQVRTIAMDMWASLEDKICYQSVCDVETRDALVNWAHMRKTVDEQMEKVLDESRGLIYDKKRVKKRV